MTDKIAQIITPVFDKKPKRSYPSRRTYQHMQMKDLVRAIEGDLNDLTSHSLSELDEGNLERVKEMFFEIAVRLD